jgi:16S rRNA (guanine527-N7)-methyltransferase
MPDWKGLQAWCLASTGLELSGAQVDQLAGYVDLLLFWNRRIALVSQSQAAPDAILVTHVADSLFAAARCGGRVADLGSGGGLPGIPIAIARPGATVCLIESVGKKASFLSEARRTL